MQMSWAKYVCMQSDAGAGCKKAKVWAKHACEPGKGIGAGQKGLRLELGRMLDTKPSHRQHYTRRGNVTIKVRTSGEQYI